MSQVLSQTVSQVMPTVEPGLRRWTRDEFYRLADLGLFDGQRAELWEGVVMVMSPQGPKHYSSVKRVARVLDVHFPASYDVRMQGPLDLGLHTEPEPDIAVVQTSPDDYAAAHPQGAFLTVEVSDTTLASDQTRKASLYARAGIPDYWIVNLVDQQLEVYRNPVPDAAQPYGHRYANVTILKRGDTVSPLVEPSLVIAVADLLP